jgi:plastocyanin/methionine-rich copper-binding protein CopC
MLVGQMAAATTVSFSLGLKVNKKMLFIVGFVVFIAASVSVILLSEDKNSSSSNLVEKKAPHYESSTPLANSTLPAPPPNVTINFNFDLADSSSIEILKDGTNYAINRTIIDKNKLSMRRNMSPDAPDGSYLVKYNACWPDGSCHDGQYQFSIDRSLLNSYQDQRGIREATILMSQIKFKPMNIRINAGQTITWVNDDSVRHYVNTDSHPAHTHVPDFNSKVLNKGDTYTYTFKELGTYPYHCSAHADSMVGMIVVE